TRRDAVPEHPRPMTVPSPPPEPNDVQAVRDLAAAYQRLTTEIGKVIVGQHKVIEQLLMSLFSRGHCLLVGVPGLAKTLLVSTVSRLLHLSFKRIQFTPDLMPSDITGTDILQDDPETCRRRFVFLPGPLFANMILADEINRTPPKTQAALLEAMQEGHVTAGGTTYRLPEPFFVLAPRPKEKDALKWIQELVSWGAGPRACQYLILGGKARAILHGRVHVTTEDIRAVSYPVLRHRIMTTFHADADGVTTDDIIKKLI